MWACGTCTGFVCVCTLAYVVASREYQLFLFISFHFISTVVAEPADQQASISVTQPWGFELRSSGLYSKCSYHHLPLTYYAFLKVTNYLKHRENCRT